MMKRFLIFLGLILALAVPSHAGRTFNGSDQYLSVASTAVSAAPHTMHCAFNVANVTANHTFLSIADTAGDVDYFRLYAAGADAGDFVKYDARTTGNLRTATTSAAFSASTWHTATAVAVDASDRTVYLDGANGGTSAISVTPAGLDSMAIGRLERATPTNFCNGTIAEVAIWNAALNASEVAALAKGFSPRLIRPQSLVCYVPLLNGIIDSTGRTWTDHSSTVGPHPRRYGPMAWSGEHWPRELAVINSRRRFS